MRSSFWKCQTMHSVFLYLLLLFLSCSLSFLISETVVLSHYAHSKETAIRLRSAGFNRYSIVDNLLEDEAFYQFRNDRQNVLSVIRFYNQLANSKVINLLSVFDQPLYIEEFKGKEDFLYGSPAFQNATKDYPTPVKALQINKNAFDFYHLSLIEDRELDWRKITYEKDQPIPLILGANYLSVYKIGQLVWSDFYSRNQSFQVVGFLPKDSFIYYKQDLEFYLDNYMIIPYPLELPSLKEEPFRFESILSFAMINSDFVSQASPEVILKEIKEISNSSGFSQFSLINLDNTLLQYDSLINLIQRNQIVLGFIIGGLFLFFAIIFYFLFLAILKTKASYYQITWLLGSQKLLQDTRWLLVSLCLLSGFSLLFPLVQFSTPPYFLVFSYFLLHLLLFFFLYLFVIKKMMASL